MEVFTKNRTLNKILFEKVQERLLQNFFKIINKESIVSNSIVDFGELTFFTEDPDYLKVKSIVTSHINVVNKENLYSNMEKSISRAMSSLICSGIGDALGTHTEFTHVDYSRQENIIDGFFVSNKNFHRCNLGEFSDDTSMTLCLADSILWKDYLFDGVDLQIKFINWWLSSYNNCLSPRRQSFGLGGNVGSSLTHF